MRGDAGASPRNARSGRCPEWQRAWGDLVSAGSSPVSRRL
ncbi:Uncharacterised protein [Amycolatopsis camponoti]|uniref:Uncharacterized protein n=1 Tax=Amycolatopsis camponoti TaxID=2606593 RepID=A0A6I8M4I4_9PSEU|nr:Uncharacterised protein [Amycolatopsis camponoti]